MWRFAGAGVTGTSHLKVGTPCQDRWRTAVHQNSTFVAVIADGAGSATMAERGAELATEAALSSVLQQIEAGRTDFAEMLFSAAMEARDAILEVANEQALAPREFASTLLAVVIGPEGGAALQIGDGVIVVGNGDGWSWVFWPQRGEYANTTRFLTDDDAASIIEVEIFSSPVRDVALMTDGVEQLALHYETRTAHERFFTPLFAPLLNERGDGEIPGLSAALEAFLKSPRTTEQADDDLTLVMATCQSPAPVT